MSLIIPKYSYDYYNEILSNYIFELGGKIEFTISFFKVNIEEYQKNLIISLKVQEANKNRLNELFRENNVKDSRIYHRVLRECIINESKISLYKKLEAEYFG